MPENHSRAGKRVEQFAVTDDPHERYRVHHPQTGEKLDTGIPILKVGNRGKVIKKEIRYYKIRCPDCGSQAEYTHDSEPVCKKCGMICDGGTGEKHQRIVRDAKAAGRLDGDDNEIPA